MGNWPDKYRPARLADVVGQAAAITALRRLVEDGYSGAIILHGPSGTGKTSAALALAAELDVSDMDFLKIESGEMDGRAVERIEDFLELYPWRNAKGYKVVLIDEAHLMTPKAFDRLLSALERIHARRIIVFTTTQSPDCFQTMFWDRSPKIKFNAVGAADMEPLLRRIAEAETGNGAALPYAAMWRSSGGSVRAGIQALYEVARLGQAVPDAPKPERKRKAAVIEVTCKHGAASQAAGRPVGLCIKCRTMCPIKVAA